MARLFEKAVHCLFFYLRFIKSQEVISFPIAMVLGGQHPGWLSPFFILWLFIVYMVDNRELLSEMVEVILDNGLQEPFLVHILDKFVMGLNGNDSNVIVSYGLAEGLEYLSIGVGQMENIFEMDGDMLNYYLVSNNSGLYEKVLSVDIFGALSDGRYQESIEHLLKYLSIQLDMGRLFDGGISDDEFDKRLSELL
jgi:hypothetical protein